MIRIGPAQLDALSRAREDAFLAAQARRLRADHGARLEALRVPGPRVPDLVRAGVERARLHGVEFEEDLVLWLDCMMILRPDFDEALPWAAEILDDAALDGAAKMERLDDALLFRPEGPA